MNLSVRDALFTKAQQKVLSLLFGQPEKSFYLNEIVRSAAMGKGAISRELAKLAEVDLLVVTKRGNQSHYQANSNAPIFNELVSIVAKNFSLTGLLKTGLASVLPRCQQVFLYGPIVDSPDDKTVDIDLLLVGDELRYSDVIVLLEPIETQVNQIINTTLYSPEEFDQRLSDGNAFLSDVMAQPQLNLLAG